MPAQCGHFYEKNMKTKLFALLVALTVITPITSEAVTYGDEDWYLGDDGKGVLIPTGGLTGFFQIGIGQYDGDGADGTGFDYLSGAREITTASATFGVINASTLTASTVSIFLGSGDIQIHDGSAVGTFNFLIGSVAGTARLELQQNGIVQYRLETDSGAIKLSYAVLIAEDGPRSQPVPDAGGSLVLLGFGLLSSAALRRKIAV